LLTAHILLPDIYGNGLREIVSQQPLSQADIQDASETEGEPFSEAGGNIR
jgi:hypothetical protein